MAINRIIYLFNASGKRPSPHKLEEWRHSKCTCLVLVHSAIHFRHDHDPFARHNICIITFDIVISSTVNKQHKITLTMQTKTVQTFKYYHKTLHSQQDPH